MIEIVEKEAFKTYDSWNERDCLMYPVIMIKNNIEHFIFNRREPQESYKEQENKKILRQLKENDGMYATFYSPYQHPMVFLKNIIENRYTFCKEFTEFIENNQGRFVDFSGNLNEISSAFMYRIYDKKIEKDLREIVGHINKKEWDKAEVLLIEKEKQYKDFKIKKDITYGLNYNEFMKLIDSKVESVKDCLNYEIFKTDIELLKNANIGCGLSAVTSNNWLKKICNLSEIELKSYVDNYKKGLLNPFLEEHLSEIDEEFEV